MKPFDKQKKGFSKLALTAGALLLAWNAITAVDTVQLVQNLEHNNKFESALPLRLADDFRETATGRKIAGNSIGDTAIDVVEGIGIATGALGVVTGHTIGVIAFDK